MRTPSIGMYVVPERKVGGFTPEMNSAVHEAMKKLINAGASPEAIEQFSKDATRLDELCIRFEIELSPGMLPQPPAAE